MTADQTGPPTTPSTGDGDHPGAYWFWSSIPSKAEMRAQLAEFRTLGFGTILIQARLSMPRDQYLSGRFLAAYAEALEIMTEFGLSAGLYDDYNWISGQAGGRTVEGADHLRERHLFWATQNGPEGQVSGIRASMAAGLGPAVADWLYEGGRPVFADWQVVAALLHPASGTVGVAIDTIDVTDAVEICVSDATSCRFRIGSAVPEGWRLTIFLAARCVSSRLINYLMPEAGERFVARGLAPFARAAGGRIPKPLGFLFFDQPAPGFYEWAERSGNLGNSLLYDEVLRSRLEAPGSSPFGRQLLALVHDIGPETPSLRCRFYLAYAMALYEGFLHPLRTFCEAQGLQLTGHEVLPHIAGFALNGGFASIDPRVAPAVDFFGIDAWRDVTAVDANNLTPQLAPRLGDSLARKRSRRGCMTELYFTATRTEVRPAGMWELTPAALRAQMIRLHMLGARQIILHALYQSAGNATPEPLANLRFDFPPGFNLEPWAPYLPTIADETAGLARFLAGARPQAQSALFYPLHTALAEGPRHAHARHFGQWAERLFDLGQDYLIVNEESLAEVDFSGPRPVIHGTEIAALILPAVTLLGRRATADHIEALQRSGCPLWLSGDVPELACDGPLRIRPDHMTAEPPDPALLAVMLDGLALPGPRVSGPAGLRHHLAGRDEAAFWRLVLFNDGTQPAETVVALGSACAYRVIDPTTGAETETGEVRRLRLRLGPGDLICLRLAESTAAGRVSRPGPSRPSRTVPLREGWTLATEGPPRPISVEVGWERQGQPAFSGLGCYETEFALDGPTEAELYLPGLACAATISLDGVKRGSTFRPPFRVSLGHISAGRHRLTVTVANTGANRFYSGTPFAGAAWPDPSGLTEPPYLVLLAEKSEELAL